MKICNNLERAGRRYLLPILMPSFEFRCALLAVLSIFVSSHSSTESLARERLEREDPNWPLADQRIGLGPNTYGEAICNNKTWLVQQRRGNYNSTMYLTIRGIITEVISYGELILPRYEENRFITRFEGGRISVLVEQTNQPDIVKVGSIVDLAFLDELNRTKWSLLRAGRKFLTPDLIQKPIFVRTSKSYLDKLSSIHSYKSNGTRPFKDSRPLRRFSRCLLTIGPDARTLEME